MKAQIGVKASRREGVRLEKAIMRLANARIIYGRNHVGELRAVAKAFPDLMPAGIDKTPEGYWYNAAHPLSRPMDVLVRAGLHLRGAWNLPEGILRRVVLLNLATTYRGKSVEGFAEIAGSLPHLFYTRTVTTRGFIDNREPRGFSDVESERLRQAESDISRDAFLRLLLHAHDVCHKMRVCQNPKCPHPYYLRNREEGGKKFCSKVCAAPSQRAAKLKWWNQHKKELLAKRKSSRRSPRRRKKSNRKGKRQ